MNGTLLTAPPFRFGIERIERPLVSGGDDLKLSIPPLTNLTGIVGVVLVVEGHRPLEW